MNEKLSRLRASVLGANDGIVSVASIVVGVAGAANKSNFILTAGVAGLVAGALSMALGEYVSVSAQRDTEEVMFKKNNSDSKDLVNPWAAAFASGLSFCLGAIIPLVTIMTFPASIRIPFTFLSVVIALILIGALSAYVGEANKYRAIVRVTIGGMIAMAVTYSVGKALGVAGV